MSMGQVFVHDAWTHWMKAWYAVRPAVHMFSQAPRQSVSPEAQPCVQSSSEVQVSVQLVSCEQQF